MCRMQIQIKMQSVKSINAKELIWHSCYFFLEPETKHEHHVSSLSTLRPSPKSFTVINLFNPYTNMKQCLQIPNTY